MSPLSTTNSIQSFFTTTSRLNSSYGAVSQQVKFSRSLNLYRITFLFIAWIFFIIFEHFVLTSVELYPTQEFLIYLETEMWYYLAQVHFVVFSQSFMQKQIQSECHHAVFTALHQLLSKLEKQSYLVKNGIYLFSFPWSTHCVSYSPS